MLVNGHLKFHTLGAGELQNAVIERLTTLQRGEAAHANGRIIFDTDVGSYFFSYNNTWQAVATGGDAAALQATVDAIIAASGGIYNADGTYNAATLDALTNVTGATSLSDALAQLDAAISTAIGIDTLAEMNDVTITTSAAGDVLYTTEPNVWVNGSLTAAGIQAHDDVLDDLSALAVVADDQLIIGTGAGTFGYITMSPYVQGLIDDVDQATLHASLNLVIGTDVQAYDATLDGLAAFTGTGIVVATGTDTFTNRSIDGTTNNITVLQGDGVAGNPTIDLTDVGTAVIDSFVKVTTDAKGRVTATTAVATADITGLVDSVYVNAAGDTMTGTLNMGTTNKIVNLASPVDAGDATNKAYVDAIAEGLHVAPAVKAATTGDLGGTYADGTVDGELGIGATITIPATATLDIDGITAWAVGDGILVKNQTQAAENGRYYVSTVGDGSTAWVLTRCGTCDESHEIPSSFVFVQSGTTQEATGWAALVGDPAVFVVGTSAITWTQFSGAGQFQAGTGLTLDGNTFTVRLGAGIEDFPTGEVGVHLYNYTTNPIGFADGTGARRAEEALAQSGDTIRLFIDGTTLSASGTGLKVATGGITNTEVSASAGIEFSKFEALTSGNILVGSVGNVATSVAMTGDVTISNTGVTTIGASKVTNAMLVNDSITVNGDTGTADVALGTAYTIAGGTGIATSITGSTVTVSGTDASTTVKGIASFSATDFTVTAGNVELVAKGISSLTDADATGATDGQVLAYDATGAQFVPQSIYFLYDGTTSAAIHTVTHNLGAQYCNVTVVDANNEVIIPQSITFTSANALEVTFNTAITCKVIVMGVA